MLPWRSYLRLFFINSEKLTCSFSSRFLRTCYSRTFLDSLFFVLGFFLFFVFTRLAGTTLWRHSSLSKLSTVGWWQSKTLEYFLLCTWAGGGEMKRKETQRWRRVIAQPFCSRPILAVTLTPARHLLEIFFFLGGGNLDATLLWAKNCLLSSYYIMRHKNRETFVTLCYQKSRRFRHCRLHTR